MNIFQKRIENLCDEIIGRILALMQANSVSEVILTDNDNPVYVIWFDKTGDPYECSVHKVTAVREGNFGRNNCYSIKFLFPAHIFIIIFFFPFSEFLIVINYSLLPK